MKASTDWPERRIRKKPRLLEGFEDLTEIRYDAFLTGMQKSVTAYIIFEGWNRSDLYTNRGYHD